MTNISSDKNDKKRVGTMTGTVLVLLTRDCVSTSRPALFRAAILAEMSEI